MSSPSAPPADQRSSAVAGGGGVHGEFGVMSRPAHRPSGRAAHGVCVLSHADTNPLDLRVVQVLRNSQVIRADESSTVRSAARFTPD